MYKNLQAKIWHLNTQKYKTLFNLEKKNTFLYKQITAILMVKILDFHWVRNSLWERYCVYAFFDLLLFGFLLEICFP